MPLSITPFLARALRTPPGSSLNAASSGMPVAVTSQSARARGGAPQIATTMAKRPMARSMKAPQTGLHRPARLLDDSILASPSGEFGLAIINLTPRLHGFSLFHI